MANTARLVIDPVSRKISTKYEKIRLVQHDNNSTRVTFEMPRYVRGHDMSRCSTVEVHYDNISLDRKQKRSDVYVVTDIIVAPEDDETINFSWLVSRGATQIVGNLDFSLHFGCNEDPDLEYEWHTTPYSGIVVLEGKHNTPSVVEKHPDLVASILDYVDKKISEFDAVDIAQETGDSTEAVMSQKATTDALGGKVDKIVSNWKAYTTDGIGNTVPKALAANPSADGVVLYNDGGIVKTNAPVEDNDATNKKFVEDGLAGKLDIILPSEVTAEYAYTVTPYGNGKRFMSGVENGNGNIVVYRTVSDTDKKDKGATINVTTPMFPYNAANKKWTEENFVPRAAANQTFSVYGTGGLAEDGRPKPLVYPAQYVGRTVSAIAQWQAPNSTYFDTQIPNCTIGVADPIKPIQAANMRYVDAADAILQEDLDFLKRHAFGTLYDLETVESTTNPVTVPANALPAATLDKIGTGIKTEVINEAIPNTSSPTDAPNGIIASYDATTGLYTISSDAQVHGPIVFPISSSIEVKADEHVYLSIEVVSGSFESDYQGSLACGAYGIGAELFLDNKFLLHEQVIDNSFSVTDVLINLAGSPTKYNDLTLRIHIGKQKQTYGVPVASVKKGTETVYTVPTAIRALEYGERHDGDDVNPVYGLAMSDTVYNYLDLENKQYVVRCYTNFLGEIAETNATIDVSEHLTDEDGEITVAAGDKILFADADGNSAGSTVPNTITYAVKKGG